MNTNSIVKQMLLRQVETLIWCLVTMWQTSKLCADWLRGFGLVIFSLENQLRGRPATKVNNDELKAVVEGDTS